jgi:HEAT repeats
MGKKRRILFAALLVVLLSGFAWWLLRPGEPSYNGRTLSSWLTDYGRVSTGDSEPDEAVRHIGTNAIPILLEMLRAKDSPLKKKSIKLLDRQDLVRIEITTDTAKAYEAALAFNALGAGAVSAVPDLIKIYEQKISVTSQYSTAEALGGIGPTATDAIPALLQGLKSTNAEVRCDTVWALGRIHGEPASVVPQLQKALHDPTGYVRVAAIVALGFFGTNAASAIPDLTAMLNDQNEYMRGAATNTLKQIDPEAAAKAGVK